MTNLTLRHHRGYFFVVVPDTKIMKFKSRREAKNWCVERYPGRRYPRAVGMRRGGRSQ